MKQQQIDFVVTWLDSSDPEWQESHAYYSQSSKRGIEDARFRNIETFRYWFRAVERYAPWVHKIFLITNGKFPDWINKECPKLELVKHEDYMPKEILPTFNSCAIELHMHKIKGLSEHFVYFNDDMILNSPVKPEYYFKNGLPCDTNKETCYNVPIYTSADRYGIYMSMLSNIGILNSQFKRWNTVCQSPKRWFGSHLGIRGFIVSCILARQRLFIGFSNYHTEQAYLKSIFHEVWEKEPNYMNASCTKFRQDIIANPYIFRYWQFAKNLFYPKRRDGLFFLMKEDDLDRIEKTLFEEKAVSVCLNDTPLTSDEEFIFVKERLQQLFSRKFPEKSSFEK